MDTKQIPIFIDEGQPERDRKDWFVTYNYKEYDEEKDDFVVSRVGVRFHNFLEADKFAKGIKRQIDDFEESKKNELQKI